MLSSFLHNCQQSFRTDRHVYLLCDLEHRFLLSFQAPCQLATGLQEKRSLPLSKAQKNVDKTRLRLSCWASNLVCTGQILFIRHRANWLLLCPTAREPRDCRFRGGGGARLRKTIVLVTLSHLRLPWALLPHTGDNSSASGSEPASSQSCTHSSVSQCLFSAQCLPVQREVDIAEY